MKKQKESTKNYKWVLLVVHLSLTLYLFYAVIVDEFKIINLNEEIEDYKSKLSDVPVIGYEERIYTCWGSKIKHGRGSFTISPTKKVDCQGFTQAIPEANLMGIGWIAGVAEPIRVNQEWIDNNCKLGNETNGGSQ